MNNITKSELQTLINSMREEIQNDTINGTEFPQFYKEVLEDLNQAEISLQLWDYDRYFDIIWNINLDILDIIDNLDNIIWTTIFKLYRLQKKLKNKKQNLPTEIYNLLQEINKKIENYK